ncbi:MAG: right-handed parallel beta-helix repeat-containing protein [Actinomycetales bacterium]
MTPRNTTPRKTTRWLVHAAVAGVVAVLHGHAPTAAIAAETTTTTTASRTVTVSTADELAAALKAASAGTTIQLRDGLYQGRFRITASGTPQAPIRIVGSRAAILDGGSIETGYVLHLDRASYVEVHGITVRNGSKGIILDEATHNVLSDLDVHTTGDELVHLRNNSSDNTITGCDIHDSGLVHPGWGEGVYIGLWHGNWSTSQSRTGGEPDRSDRNLVSYNHIHSVTAEPLDLKEGTSAGRIIGNLLEADGLTGENSADSWADVKGNDYLITGNEGRNGGTALKDGWQVHQPIPGSGTGNVFDGNTGRIASTGFGIRVDIYAGSNTVRTTNTFVPAASGLTNVAVS